MLTKENNVFDKRDFFTYNTNGLLQKTQYLALYGYQEVYTAKGEFNFTRDFSGIIGTITGDRQLNAFYNPDLSRMQPVLHFLTFFTLPLDAFPAKFW